MTIINKFQLHSKHQLAGDQTKACAELIKGLRDKKRDQILLGVTGSGKTFTMANIIFQTQRPAIIMVHNKTLAAQLFNEMKQFFPDNAVEYFVSYYDYYQPEAYIAKKDVYIEKDSAINKKIEILRHSATRSIIQRKDVIIVTSVSSIYGLGSPQAYAESVIYITKNQDYGHETLIKKLVDIDYERDSTQIDNGKFQVKGDLIYIQPPYMEDECIVLEFFGDTVENIWIQNTVTKKKRVSLEEITIFPATHYTASRNLLKQVATEVKKDLDIHVKQLLSEGKDLIAQRISQRTRYDIEMMLEIGHFKGIENYSRYTDGRKPGQAPYTLFDYIPKDTIIFVDESHATLPQIKAMYAGDKSRKTNLIEHGFRLPSALDNRPLKFEEWDKIRNQTIYISATPANLELELTKGEIVEQIIRPTGLLDPICEIRKTENYFDDLIKEIKETSAKNLRTIVIVLTKKSAEKTHAYFQEMGLRSMYIHSETDTLDRIEIIKSLREKHIDVIIGINLLREGIDIPECGLVAITDADKTGFLRSKTSLVQIVGRAARNASGKVIFYADVMTEAIKETVKETKRRREIQEEFNKKNNITPQTIIKSTDSVFDTIFGEEDRRKMKIAKERKQKNHNAEPQTLMEIKKAITNTTKKMKASAKNLLFEKAAELKEELDALIAKKERMEKIQEEMKNQETESK